MRTSNTSTIRETTERRPTPQGDGTETTLSILKQLLGSGDVLPDRRYRVSSPRRRALTVEPGWASAVTATWSRLRQGRLQRVA